MNNKFFEAIATLTGCVIGAGILGIPYVVSKSGFTIGLIWLILLGLSALLINLYLGEIVLRTKGFHQLTGYAKRYLGKYGRIFMTFSMIIGIYGALLAYIIGVGSSLNTILPGLTDFQWSLIFFIFVTLIVLIGIEIIEKMEIGMSIIIISIVAFIAVYMISSTNFLISNLKFIDTNNIFMPYGVILFAYLGTAAIPEMHEELKDNKRLIKKSIIIGSIIPIILYIVFTLVAIGVSGTSITEISTIGLGLIYGKWMIIFLNIFAVFAMTTSFLSLGLALKEMYHFDFKLKSIPSWSLTVIVPLALFLLSHKSFIEVLWFAGSIAAGLAGILIVLMHWNGRKYGNRKPEYTVMKSYIIGSILIILFTAGIIYEILI